MVLKREGTHAYVWPIHVDYGKKPSQYCKVIILQLKKNNQRWAEDLNIHFSKDGIQMAKKHETMFNVTNYQRKANQNYNETYHFTLVRMATIKKSTNSKCWRDCGEKNEPSYTVGENINWYNQYKEQYGSSLKS